MTKKPHQCLLSTPQNAHISSVQLCMSCNTCYRVHNYQGPQFSAECGISIRAMEFAHFRRIFMFFTEFCGIWYCTNMAYFDGVRATVLYVYMISPWNTWLLLGLWREEYCKILSWAYLKYCRLIW